MPCAKYSIKGLLNDDINVKGVTYSVNDVFLSHWLERL